MQSICQSAEPVDHPSKPRRVSRMLRVHRYHHSVVDPHFDSVIDPHFDCNELSDIDGNVYRLILADIVRHDVSIVVSDHLGNHIGDNDGHHQSARQSLLRRNSRRPAAERPWARRLRRPHRAPQQVHGIGRVQGKLWNNVRHHQVHGDFFGGVCVVRI